jgi:transposase InsO family protein
MLPSVYPVRTAEDVILQMKENFKVFTELDLKIAFWQIEIEARDGEICAAVTDKDIYLPQRLVQGAKDSSAILEKCIREYLVEPVKEILRREFIPKDEYAVEVFRDNLFIGTTDNDSHKKVLEVLIDRSKDLNLKYGSGEVGKSEINVLGFILSSEGVRPIEKNLVEIKGATIPKNIKGLRSFLGKTGFYRQLIPKYAEIVQPLENLLSKGKAFVWGQDQNQAFEILKKEFGKELICTLIDPSKPVEVWVDASGIAAGAVLIQNGKIARSFSKKFNSAQQRYDPRRREALAIRWAARKWKHLFNGETVVYTDHKGLENWLRTNSMSDSLMDRWALELQEYPFVLRWKAGKDNALADGLSRKIMAQDTINEEKVSITEKDIREYLKDQKRFENDQRIKNLEAKSRRYKLIDDQLYLRSTDGDYPVPEVDGEERRQWLIQLHEELGHATASSMLKILKTSTRWDMMAMEIDNVVSRCWSCQHGRSKERIPEEEKSNWVGKRHNYRLWDEISIDLIVDLPVSQRKNRYILLITEGVSGWVEAYALKTKSAKEVAGALYDFVCRFCAPRRLRCDRGGEFQAGVEEFCRMFGIIQVTTSAYHPQGNAQAERSNKELITMIEKYCLENPDWDLQLPNALLAMRIRPSRRTGLSPYQIVFGENPRIPLIMNFRIGKEELPFNLDSEIELERYISGRSAEYQTRWELVRKRLQKYQSEQEKREYKAGDLVMARKHKRTKGTPRWIGPLIVLNNTAKGVEVKSAEGNVLHYTLADVKRYKDVYFHENVKGDTVENRHFQETQNE